MTVGGSGDTIQLRESEFGASHQQLAPLIFKIVENQSFDAVAAADESVNYDVCDYSTAEELVIPNVFAGGSDIGLRDVGCGLVQMKVEEPDCKENSSLYSKPRKARELELMLQSDGENVLPSDFGEILVSVHFESSFSKQDKEREQSLDYEVKKASSTDWNQLSIGLSDKTRW